MTTAIYSTNGDHMSLFVRRVDGSEHTILFDLADADVVLAHHWNVRRSQSGVLYAVTTSRKKIRMHRLLIDSPSVDHINHNGLDNRRANLRPASRTQQLANQRPVRGGSSKYKGVYLDKFHGRWVARIGVDGRMRFIGIFGSQEDAARAYDAAAIALWGEYACPNFPRTPEP